MRENYKSLVVYHISFYMLTLHEFPQLLSDALSLE